MVLRYAGAFVALLAAAAGAPVGAEAKPAEDSAVVLGGEDYWRKHFTFFTPRISVAAATAAGLPADPDARANHIARFYYSGFDTPPPPAGWAEPDFDDSAWQLARGRQFLVGDSRRMEYKAASATSAYLRGTDPFVEEVGLVCLRGRFRVPDRAKVRKLMLSLTCRGGFVAYLNGREVARASLPAGKLTPRTPADDYPLEAFFVRDSIGKTNPVALHTFTHSKSDQWALRERHFAPTELPLDGLRSGVNVLAVELHRSDYPAECKRKNINWRSPRSLSFATVGLSLLRLSAEPAGAAERLVPTAGALQVWNRDLARPVGRAECPNRDERLSPVRIVAARNGAFSGQVIVRCDKPLEGVAATASALAHAGGKGRIPAEASRIRYGAVHPTNRGAGTAYLEAVLPPEANVAASLRDGRSALHGRFDMLLDEPPAGANCMPVWVTVRVPKAAAVGRYTGELTIAVKGRDPVTTPIELTVADWTLPDVKDCASLINVYQSPDTLAAYYKVPPWSAPHWRMIERSLALMGEIGNIGLFFPLLAESQFGNPESMVVWIRKPDGSYGYDFRVFDRYLDTALRHHARLKFLGVCVWGYQARGRKGAKPYGAQVTVLDPATGKRSNVRLPDYGTPECEKLWRPLLTAIKARLAAKGLDGLMLLGLPADGTPHWTHVAMFRRILPAVAWIRESHYNIHSFRYDAEDKKATVPVAYNSIVWGGEVPDPAAKRLYGWRHNPRHLVMTFNRAGASALNLHGFARPWSYRMWMESTLAGGRNGNGRVGGDYWRIGMRPRGGGRVSSEAGGGCGGTLYGSYLPSSVGQVGLGNSTTDLFAPAPGGPVATVRLENAREGNQEAEARIFIEKALLDKDRPLPEALAEKCQRLLDERTNVLRMVAIGAGGIARVGWQRRSQALYDLAGEVQRAPRPSPGPPEQPARAAKPT